MERCNRELRPSPPQTSEALGKKQRTSKLNTQGTRVSTPVMVASIYWCSSGLLLSRSLQVRTLQSIANLLRSRPPLRPTALSPQPATYILVDFSRPTHLSGTE